MEFDHVAQQVPDIAEAVEWQRRTIPGSTVLHQDATWALVESGGAKLAFVLPDQHPSHLAYRVAEEAGAAGRRERRRHRHPPRRHPQHLPGGPGLPPDGDHRLPASRTDR